ncbi:MAG: DUF4349 domain-containing protein [Anaerolineae bacterium]|nr:DUF4349 domain-containing protein [Anaerolineae bacterium]
MNKWMLWGLIVVLTLSIFGCAAKTTTSELNRTYGLDAPQGVVVEQEKMVEEAPVVAWDGDNGAGAPGVDTSTVLTNVDRKIIYNVYLNLIVEDTQATFDQIRQLTIDMGGFVADSNTWKDGGQLRGTLTVRIPAGSLQDALSQFKGLALDIESERMDSQDVTEEYVDLEARLANLQRTEEELLELLATRSATGKTSDILEVHREITSVRAQIEQIQGRMKYLNNLSALATVNITLTPDELLQPVVVAGWRPEGTAREAVRALLRTLQFFADVIIVFVIYILPVLIVIAIPIAIAVLIIRALWKWNKHRRQAKKATADQEAK